MWSVRRAISCGAGLCVLSRRGRAQEWQGEINREEGAGEVAARRCSD